MEKNQQHLQKGLSPRHVQFIALAGMIGTGIFKGSSDTVSLAGPSVALAYFIGGVLLFIVMLALGEMALVYPGLNVQNLIHKAFGSRISFIIGWLYWINWVIVTVVELIAAGSFLKYWFPGVPLWQLSFICAAFIIGINLIEVKYYGEFEFWIAGIKIITLIAFILLGGLILFGLFPGTSSTLSNYTAHGGFFPHGFGGTFSAFLVVMFSYGGAELIGVTVSETKNSEKVLPQVIKQTVVRVMLFYILPILIICGIIPWNQVSSAESPFVQVFSSTGIPAAAHVMNFVLLTAVLSAANSGIYATSRTLFNMAQSGEAPRAFLKISKKGIPHSGILLTALFILAGIVLAYLTPDQVISYLMAIPGFTVLLVWMAICGAQLKLRKSYKKRPAFHVKGYPFVTWIAFLALAGIFLAFLLGGSSKIGTTVCLIILAVLIALSLRVKETAE
ncbi:putative amino acid permease YvbW [Weizmannia acidilactici]|uniref:Amino acid permease YvbW n=1 Tax=Weizmannia acidilactici TaxID=2607726 RepID=A0A5J4JL55_9BACI|nr:amino acid permease [Weizmannia acidilactici]GER67946.1 putative amino acid permease YvbW [Weizmannia acidilactici]GER71107.1 putative amino acid permease YvbW [Weizmannia acidilactici]GER73816.1 putative amino acid permease YvbW [Weizmannia acidilactici]